MKRALIWVVLACLFPISSFDEYLLYTPDTLDFGDNCMTDHWYSIDAYIVNNEFDTIAITNILLPPSLRNFILVSQRYFLLAFGDTARLTVSFRTDREVRLSAWIRVEMLYNNTELSEFWKVIAVARIADTTQVDESHRLIPQLLSLAPPYPNPFNSTTTIFYTLPSPGWTTMDVMDISGRLVTRLSDGWKEAGSYRAILQGRELPSGTFVLRLEGGKATVARKIELVK